MIVAHHKDSMVDARLATAASEHPTRVETPEGGIDCHGDGLRLKSRPQGKAAVSDGIRVDVGYH